MSKEQVADLVRFAEELADAYVVMERGEVIRRGRGDQMQADGIRKLVSV